MTLIKNVAIALLNALNFPQTPARPSAFTRQLVAAAAERTQHVVRYDPAYVRIPYPNGDVPADTGVCTDEIIRIYRSVGTRPHGHKHRPSPCP